MLQRPRTRTTTRFTILTTSSLSGFSRYQLCNFFTSPSYAKHSMLQTYECWPGFNLCSNEYPEKLWPNVSNIQFPNSDRRCLIMPSHLQGLYFGIMTILAVGGNGLIIFIGIANHSILSNVSTLLIFVLCMSHFLQGIGQFSGRRTSWL